MKIKKWVKSIQNEGYNGARMVSIAGYIYKRQTQRQKKYIFATFVERPFIKVKDRQLKNPTIFNIVRWVARSILLWAKCLMVQVLF
jgi:hypothetical protein